MNYKNLTIGIVTFKSEKVIFNCLDSIKKFKNIIIFDNSNDKKLKFQIKKKYPHIKFILSKKNIGFGAGYNQIIKITKSKYFFLISPDTILNSNCVKNLMIVAKKLKGNFNICAPKSNEINYGFFDNGKIPYGKFKDKIFKVDYVKGFAMFFNLKKFHNKKIFDQNIFLYLEEIDLCKRIKKYNGNIYIVKKAYIKHLFAKSSNIGFEYDKCRNWHWMWSKTYFNLKHKTFINSFFKAFLDIIKNFIYGLACSLFNSKKSLIYLLRASGTFNALIGNKSWYRPELMSRKFN